MRGRLIDHEPGERPGGEFAMSQSIDPAPPTTKLLGPFAIRLRLITASAVILVVGSALAPARENRAPSRTEERANPLIEEQLAATTASAAAFTGVASAARLPRAHVLEIRPVRSAVLEHVRSDVPQPASIALEGAAVMVSDGYLLTYAAALDGRLAVQVVTADGRAGDAVLAAYDPATGLVLLRTAPGLAPAAVLASAPPAAGSLAVAVGHAGGRPIARPAFVTLTGPGRVVVTPSGSGTAPGLPVFTVEGSLVGVIGAPGSGEVVLASGVVDRLIASAAAGDVPRSFGLAVQRLDGVLTQVFGNRGVLVSDVVPGGPAALAGLESGDVLLAVGETGITSLDEARQALAAAALEPVATLRVLQRRRERAVEVKAASSYTTAHLARVDPARDAAISAGAVLRPPLLTALGLSAETRVLSVNGVPAATRAAADRALAARRPVDVLHVRDDRGAWFVAMERAR